MRGGNVAVARTVSAEANDVASGRPARGCHIAFFDLVFAGRTDAATA
jgi:hypothetical protein